MSKDVKVFKTITIDVTNPANTTIAVVDCDGQDLYRGLCVLMAHIKPKLKEPDMIKHMVGQALIDIEKMERNH